MGYLARPGHWIRARLTGGAMILGGLIVLAMWVRG